MTNAAGKTTGRQTENAARAEVARQVRQAIALVPLLEGMTLEVDEPGIYASAVGNQHWWRVPLIPTPYPQRLFPLYELMAEIDKQLRSENHTNVILFSGDFTT